MNATIDLLMKRKSVRVYADQPVAAVEREIILRAALRAPTAGNMMLYSIIEVEDQALKDRLAETCDHQPFIARAPYVLIFLADYQRWHDYYLAGGVPQLCDQRGEPMRHPEEGDLMLACCDALIAAHTAVIAAESLGIGSCYIGDIIENFETHRQLLNLPQYVLPVTMLCFGYPTPEQLARKQPPRFEKPYVVHKNAYQRLDAAELEQMMENLNRAFQRSETRPDGIENVGQWNYMRKFSAEFSREMTRSVRAMLASWATHPQLPE